MKVLIDGVEYAPRQIVKAGGPLGPELKRMRDAIGLTLEEAAQRTGITKGYLWKIEHDHNAVSFGILARLASVYGASLDDLAKLL